MKYLSLDAVLVQVRKDLHRRRKRIAPAAGEQAHRFRDDKRPVLFEEAPEDTFCASGTHIDELEGMGAEVGIIPVPDNDDPLLSIQKDKEQTVAYAMMMFKARRWRLRCL